MIVDQIVRLCIPQVAETKTPRRMDAAGELLLYHESKPNVAPVDNRFRFLQLIGESG